jgi:Ser/Thr protein kinase RdoA (MazF antagonist)
MDMSESAAFRYAHHAISGFGLNGEAKIIHHNHKIIFSVPSENKVLRVHEPSRTLKDVLEERSLALTAKSKGVLTVIEDNESDPIIVKDRVVEIQRLLTCLPGSPQFDIRSLGAQLRKLHDTPAHGLKEIDPFLRLESYIQQAPHNPQLENLFKKRLPALRVSWDSIQARSNPVFLHGNVFRSNMIRTKDGQYLIDFSESGLGPWIYDFACIGLSARRFQLYPSHFEWALKIYGARLSVQHRKDIEDIIHLLELTSLAWLNCRNDRKARLELSWRLRTLDSQVRWKRI